MSAEWEPSEHFEKWPGCLACGYYRHNKCAAYPERIPFLIISGQIDHMVERPGQVPGIVFAPMDPDHWRRTRERIPLRKPSATTVGE